MIPIPVGIIAARGGAPGETGPIVTHPYPRLGFDVYSGTVGATVDLDLLANDDPVDGSGVLTLTSVGVSAGSASILNNRARVTYPAAPQTVYGTYTAKNGTGLSSTGAFEITVQAVAVPTSLRFSPPHKPASESEVAVWSCPVAGGSPPQGDWSKYLLIAMPNAPVTGAIVQTALRYKGVLLKGAAMRPAGTVAKTTGGGNAPVIAPVQLARNEVGVAADFGPDRYTLPASGNVIPVSTATQLTTALTNAQPGDHIVLANGTYGGTFTLSANGTAAAPIVVRSANLNGAVLSGMLKLTGQYSWAYGLSFTGMGGGSTDGPLQLRGSRNTASRCRFTGRRGVYVPSAARYWSIGYCEFLGSPPSGAPNTIRYDSIMVDDNNGAIPRWGHIYRCFFHSPETNDDSPSHHIYVGNSYNNTDDPVFTWDDLIAERCLFGTSSNPTNLRRCHYTKRAGSILYCTVYASRGTFGLRDGKGGRIWGCHVEGVNTFNVNNSDHDLRGNRARNLSDGAVVLQCDSGVKGGGLYRAADNAFLLWNDFAVHVGHQENTPFIDDVRGVRIYNHTGTVTLLHQTGTIQNNNYTGPETGGSSSILGLEAVLDLQFDGNDAAFPSGLRPYLWIDGLDYDAAAAGSPGVSQSIWWGHLLKVGTADTAKNRFDRWCDVILQRVRIANGHYWLEIAGDTDPQSHYLRPASGYRRLLLWRHDAAWHGTGVLAHGTNLYPPHPEGYVELADIAFRPMPSSTAVKASWTNESVNFLDADDPTLIDPATAKYYGLYIKNLWLKPESWTDKTSYVLVKSPATRTVGASRIDLSSYKAAAHPYNYTGATSGGAFNRTAGSFDAFANLGTPGQAMVTTSEVGTGVRVTTAQGLLDYLGVVSPPQPATFRSGLTWRSGVRDGTATVSQANAIGTWRGRPIDMVLTYIDNAAFDVSWAACINYGSIQPGGTSADFHSAGIQVRVSVPLLIKSEAGQFARGAAGAFDTYHQQIANKLKAIFGSDMFWIGLGWEANRGYWWEFEGPGISQAANYKSFWRRTALLYKNTCPGARLVWNNLKSIAVNLNDFYPGNDCVDVIGIDPYDNGSGAYADDAAGWTRMLGSYNASTGNVQGLGGMLAYAKAKGKKLSIDEWGPTNKTQTAADPANNSYYVSRMYEFFEANAADIEFECYSNYGNHRIYPKQSWLNLASDAYLAKWRP